MSRQSAALTVPRWFSWKRGWSRPPVIPARSRGKPFAPAQAGPGRDARALGRRVLFGVGMVLGAPWLLLLLIHTGRRRLSDTATGGAGGSGGAAPR